MPQMETHCSSNKNDIIRYLPRKISKIYFLFFSLCETYFASLTSDQQGHYAHFCDSDDDLDKEISFSRLTYQA